MPYDYITTRARELWGPEVMTVTLSREEWRHHRAEHWIVTMTDGTTVHRLDQMGEPYSLSQVAPLPARTR